jgi:hypothetical protein
MESTHRPKTARRLVPVRVRLATSLCSVDIEGVALHAKMVQLCGERWVRRVRRVSCVASLGLQEWASGVRAEGSRHVTHLAACLAIAHLRMIRMIRMWTSDSIGSIKSFI